MLNKEKIIITANSIFGKDNYEINQITDEFLIIIIAFTTLCELFALLIRLDKIIII